MRRERGAGSSEATITDAPDASAQGSESVASPVRHQGRIRHIVLRAYWGNKFLSLLLLIPFGLTYGWFLASMGLPRYFWDVSILQQAFAGAAVTFMILSVFYTMYITDRDLRISLRRWANATMGPKSNRDTDGDLLVAFVLLIAGPLFLLILAPGFLPLFRPHIEPTSRTVVLFGKLAWPWLFGSILCVALAVFVLSLIINRLAYKQWSRPAPSRRVTPRKLHDGTFAVVLIVGCILLFLETIRERM
jgi:hypothetical protein